MEQEKAFEIIKEVFTESINSFKRDKIENEQDWESQLYSLFRDAIGEDVFTKYLLLVEHNTAKYDGKNLLYIGPNKYGKKKELIDEYFDITPDKFGHIKIEINKNKKPLNRDIKSLLEAEKKRAYYADLILVKKSDFSRIFMIELKLGEKLDKNKVEEDLYKLRRIESVKNTEAIYIAIGFDLLNMKVFWKPTNQKYDSTFDLPKSVSSSANSKYNNTTISKEEVSNIIKETSKKVYEDFKWSKEALWSCEVRYQLSKALPSNWRCNNEISGIFESNRERLDLAIYNNSDNMEYAIELKGHYEGGIPPEIRNDMAYDKSIESEFFIQAEDFLKAYEEDKSLKNKLSKYPKLDGRDFITSDFFDKIIEMYNQCKRLSSLVNKGEIGKGYMVFIDHQDDFSIRKRKPNISENEFKNNFKFRKNLILKLLEPVIGNLELIYFYGLNVKNDKKEIFLLKD